MSQLTSTVLTAWWRCLFVPYPLNSKHLATCFLKNSFGVCKVSNTENTLGYTTICITTSVRRHHINLRIFVTPARLIDCCFRGPRCYRRSAKPKKDHNNSTILIILAFKMVFVDHVALCHKRILLCHTLTLTWCRTKQSLATPVIWRCATGSMHISFCRPLHLKLCHFRLDTPFPVNPQFQGGCVLQWRIYQSIVNYFTGFCYVPSESVVV